VNGSGGSLATAEDAFALFRGLFDQVAADLAAPPAASLTHSQLEDMLSARMREVTRSLYQDHLTLRAVTEQRLPEVTDARGVERTRIERGRTRDLTTVFGKVTVTRIAYRGTGAADLHPADAVLNLPPALHSHGLGKLAAIEAARGSFAEATDRINTLTGAWIGPRQTQELAVAAAADIDGFYDALVPAPCTDQTLLVLSADGKGVVIRPDALREGTAKAAAAKGGNAMKTRLASGEKNGRKRMATLGTVYDAEPAQRGVDDVIADPDSDTDDAGEPAERRPGPRARSKWLTGSVDHNAEQVIGAVFDQAEHRDPDHRRTWVVLVDGANHQLDLINAEARRRDVAVHIVIDIIHVIEYIWAAAWTLHAPGDKTVEAWVAGHTRTVLTGRAADTATAITAQARTARLRGPRRKTLNKTVDYLRNKGALTPDVGHGVMRLERV
jgi:hypothetical protein